MTEEKETIAEPLQNEENEAHIGDGVEVKEKEERRLSRLQKRLATTLTGEAYDEATTRKRLRSSMTIDSEPPKIIMRISKGKVTDNTGSEDEESNRRLRKRKEVDEEEEEKEKKASRKKKEDGELLFPMKKKIRGRSRSVGPEMKMRVRPRSYWSDGVAKNKQDGENKLTPTEDSKNSKTYGFCWTCHKPEATVGCATCPRMFHARCVVRTPQDLCPECSASIVADSENRGQAAKRPKLDQLCTLLKFTLERMKNVPDSEVFWKAVDSTEEPLYYEYINNPMDLTLLGRNIEQRVYGSTVAFLADARWILHNSIIFNSTQSPLTSTARAVLKVCKQELEEIEKCPDCYLNAHTKLDWFIQVCRKPHLLIWARLKGFPFWPAKALATNTKTQMVDARFFGAHDKAWVPVRDCYLLSTACPPSGCKKRGGDLGSAFAEMNEHINNIRAKLGSFVFAPEKVPYEPENADAQLASMIPGWVPPAKISGKSIEVSSNVQTVTAERLSPEDQVIRDLELMAARETGVVRETVDDTSTDCDDAEGVIRTPEHGYSRNVHKIEESERRHSSDQAELVESEKDTTQPVVKSVECESEPAELVKEPADVPNTEQPPVEAMELDSGVEAPKETQVEVTPEPEPLPVSDNKTDPGEEAAAPATAAIIETEKEVLVTDSNVTGNDVISSPKSTPDKKKEKKVKKKKKNEGKVINVSNDKAVADSMSSVVEPVASIPKITESADGPAVPDPGPISTTNPADFLQVEVKQENFDQYLEEENQTDGVDRLSTKSPALDLREPMVTLVDLKRLGVRPQRERTGSTDLKKPKPCADGKLRLSEEVSLMVLDGEAKGNNNSGPPLKPRKPNKARKTVPRPPDRLENSVTICTSSSEVTTKGPARNLNIISVDTKNSDAQKNLLKSLCLEEKKNKKHTKDIAIETSAGNGNKTPLKDGNILCQQKNIVVTSSSTLPTNLNGPLLISQNGQTFLANPQNQNLALTQNNLGQFSLVQLTNLSSGIHTNFMNLTNDTIGLQNSYPTLFAPGAPPPLSPFATPSGGVLIAPNASQNSPAVATGASPNALPNGKPERARSPPRSGIITVKTAASLGAPSPSSSVPPIDPITAQVQRYATKISETMQEALESILRNLAEDGQPEPQMRIINAEKAKVMWQHQKAMADMKKSYERKMTDLRTQLEAESQKALNELRGEMEKVIEETKKKQWCALCRKEALFYCCWNTSYCDYPCQQQHWLAHMSSCAQLSHSGIQNAPTPQTRRKLGGNAPYMIRQDEGSFTNNRPNIQLNSFPTNNYSITTYQGPGNKKKQ